MVHWAYPWLGVAGTLVIAFWLFGQWRARDRALTIAMPLAELGPLPSSSPVRQWLRRASWCWRITALLTITIAMARPQRPLDEGERRSDGIDIMLAIDTSDSMRALDFMWEGKRQDRLSVIKRVLAEFIDHRPDDRIGLVVFGTYAVAQAPLTLEHPLLLTITKQLSIGMAGKSTAIGDGLAAAVKRLKDVDSPSKVVILLTDGSNNAGDVEPSAAVTAAKELGVKVYTIGVGSDEEVPFPVQGFFGTNVVYQKFPVDHQLLDMIAKETGGQSFMASDTKALQEIYQTIDRLERKPKIEQDWHEYEELFPSWVWFALLMLVGDLLWQASRWWVLPSALPRLESIRRKGIV